MSIITYIINTYIILNAQAYNYGYVETISFLPICTWICTVSLIKKAYEVFKHVLIKVLYKLMKRSVKLFIRKHSINLI